MTNLKRAAWRKSSRSNGGGGNSNCVEAAAIALVVAVRDSKTSTLDDYPVLTMARTDWAGMIASIRSGELTG